jgi:hypothetical protein
MAKVKIQGNASGSAVYTVQTSAGSVDKTITLPDATGTLLNSDGSGASLTGVLSLTGGTLTGDVTLEAITETKTTKSASFSPDLTNDGTLYSCTGTMTITMPTATSGKSFTIIHATATSITWAGTIKWNGGSAPTADSGIDIYVFVSDGTNWYANQAGTGYA